MKTRFQNSPNDIRLMETETLRNNFLVRTFFKDDEVELVYSHYDRLIIGGVKPVRNPVSLPNPSELKADYFLQRREAGIINVGGRGTIIADDQNYVVDKLDAVYLGKETRNVVFSSEDPADPALFYILSASAHRSYPSAKKIKTEATPVELGDSSSSNKRTIFKYIHNDGIQSCQLVMGLTILNDGNVWNSIPPHTHTRRTEVYFYFDLPWQHRVFHFMGQPDQLRNMVISNHEAVISPPWSVHFGCGTSNYGFIWGMAGENKEFSDMDGVPVTELM